MTSIPKLLLGVLIAFSAIDAKPQGIVLFANQPLPTLGGPDRVVRDVGGAPLSGTNFIVELLYQNKAGTWVTHPIAAHFFDRSFPSTFAGLWNGGNRTLVNAGGVPSADPSRALPINLQVRVWDGGTGMVLPLTFDEARAAGMKRGTSDIFVYVQEFGLENNDEWMKNFQGFSLVPEPSAWALFALGMGWLFWRGRRRMMNDAS